MQKLVNDSQIALKCGKNAVIHIYAMNGSFNIAENGISSATLGDILSPLQTELAGVM